MQRNLKKLAIIGGGIAGACSAGLLSENGYETIIFEKNSGLGGCAGSFKRQDFIFNIGATTVAGLLDDFPVKRLLSKLNVLKLIKIVDPGVVIHTPKGVINRFGCLERTIDEINRVFYNKGNLRFWSTVYNTTFDILKFNYYHNFYSFKGNIKSIIRMKHIIFKYFRHFLISAEKGLREFLNQIDKDYYDFMDAHVKIVAQSNIKEVNFLTLLLSLGYPFTGIGYSEIGMGGLINSIAQKSEIQCNSEIKAIYKSSDRFILKGDFGEEIFDSLILAFPIFENMHVFRDEKIKKFFEKYIHLNTDNSAVLVYGVVKNFHPTNIFHLLILNRPLPDTSSKYIFISFYPSSINGNEYITFTVSTHTKTSYWMNLKREDYDKKKKQLNINILKLMDKLFGIGIDKILLSFVATPETFYRYLNRRSVGGIPITKKNAFFRILSNVTPFKNLYLVGDNSFCYQGWIGISIGIYNLLCNIYEKIRT